MTSPFAHTLAPGLFLRQSVCVGEATKSRPYVSVTLFLLFILSSSLYHTASTTPQHNAQHDDQRDHGEQQRTVPEHGLCQHCRR